MQSSKQPLPSWAIEAFSSTPTATKEVTAHPALRIMNKSSSQHARQDDDSLERGVPLRHVDSMPREAEFDDISSIQQSTFVEEQSAPSQQQIVVQAAPDGQGAGAERAPQPHDKNDDYSIDPATEAHQKSIRKKDIVIVATLLLFVGIVGAIGAGMVKAMQANPIGAAGEVTEANELTEADAADESVNESANNGGDESQELEVEAYNYTNATNWELGIDADQGDTTEELHPSLPTPSISPTTCIPLEIGTIFNQDASTTSWLLVEGADTASNNNVVWESTTYDDSYNSKSGTFQNCLPPKEYRFTFTLMNSGNGEEVGGVYVLSSEGNVIATSQDDVTFTLPFTAPKAIDSNNDSEMVEGVDCEPFRLEINTDNAGIETLWELYSGNDKDASRLIAEGGPYGSNSVYEYEYCLESQNRYSFFIYDWGELALSLR